MVAHLVRLKLALLRNVFRRSRAQTIGAVVGIVYFTFLVAAVTLVVATFRSDPTAGAVVLPLAGAVAVVLWSVVPLFAFGSDPTLDPARFALHPVPPRALALGLVAAALVGLPALASGVLALGVVVAWSQTPASTLTAVVCTAAGLLTAVTLSRWVTASASFATSSRRGRDALVVAGLLGFVLVLPALSLLSHVEDAGALARRASAVVGWTPLGYAWAAPGDVATGHPLVGLLRAALALATLAGVGALWARSVRRQVENPRSVSRSDVGSAPAGDLGLLGRLPDGASGGVTARVLTYWRRDPRYQVAVAMTPVLPLLLLVPALTGDATWPALLMGPLVGFLLGWSEHNGVAYESGAFWLHVASGVDGAADRRGRAGPTLLLAAVLVPVYAAVGAGVADRWDLLPAALGVALGVLGSGLAVSAVMSLALPYPVAEPGESPFTTPPGAAGVTILAQTLASTATLALGAPVLLLGWWSWVGGRPAAAWLTLVAGTALGVLVALGGLRVGARLYDRRAPDVLVALQRS